MRIVTALWLSIVVSALKSEFAFYVSQCCILIQLLCFHTTLFLLGDYIVVCIVCIVTVHCCIVTVHKFQLETALLLHCSQLGLTIVCSIVAIRDASLLLYSSKFQKKKSKNPDVHICIVAALCI